MDKQNTQVSQNNPIQSRAIWKHHHPFRLYYRATVMKTDRCTNEIEDPGSNLHTYEHLIFDKESKNIKWKKENIFNKGC